MSSVLLKSHRL
ncbi:hypothetical protein PENNAL_c0988G04187 [Penicillium nalgiovense]|uniref:Uncharacterized protein n=1 Tax=Penicillium nalgiovense TaxID=60175 RepID=A0A1V6TMI9_PENNA|nr:hypothetical protein PENNAL_c0988G04187 [Penicillium nalgiovense]